MLNVLVDLLNLVVDLVVLVAAIILTCRFRRSGSSALLALAAGFWLWISVDLLRLVGAYLVPALLGPSITSAHVEDALGITLELLRIGSFVSLTYGAMIIPIPRRLRPRIEPGRRS